MNEHVARLEAREPSPRGMTPLLKVETSLVVLWVQSNNGRRKRERVIVVRYASALPDPDRVPSEEKVASNGIGCAKRLPADWDVAGFRTF